MRRSLLLLACLFVLPTAVFAQGDGETYDVGQLKSWLRDNRLSTKTLSEFEALPQANLAMTKQQAEDLSELVRSARHDRLKSERKEEMDNREIVLGKKKMPFWYKVFGGKDEAPDAKRSLFISMHGGGGAPARVNDRQYENQKRLYEPEEGVYLVPRAPTDTWNLWHQGHIDDFFDRLITNMIIFERVDPNRVYIMGYSAGGDGVYQLAPRMADRLAAAAMMAGHPNETKPDSLRNIGFAIFMGGKDAAYKRNQIAANWKVKLAELAESDPGGYRHEVTIFEEFGHWMQRKDAVGVPWMAKFTRDPFPKKIVWLQDDVAHSRFYWLSVTKENQKKRSRIVASIKDNTITIEESDVKKLTVLLSDEMLDLDQPVRIVSGDAVLFEGKVQRTAAHVAKSLVQRHDTSSVFTASVDVELP